MKGFKIAINMAGAISAGAYTAGVVDFITEALDAWYRAKAEGAEVPQHDVTIEGFSGASAGGLCAALSAVLLLDELAVYGSTRGKRPEAPRPYVSPDLTVFLSLTNLRGVLYSLNGLSPGGVEETTSFFGDRIRFQTVRADSRRPLGPAAYPVDMVSAQGDFELLKNAAMATGAFPMFLAPRVLTRRHSDYTPPLWELHGSDAKDDAVPVSPSFPPGMADPFETL